MYHILRVKEVAPQPLTFPVSERTFKFRLTAFLTAEADTVVQWDCPRIPAAIPTRPRSFLRSWRLALKNTNNGEIKNLIKYLVSRGVRTRCWEGAGWESGVWVRDVPSSLMGVGDTRANLRTQP